MADKKETADGGWLMENCHKCDPSEGVQGAHGIITHEYCIMPSVTTGFIKFLNAFQSLCWCREQI